MNIKKIKILLAFEQKNMREGLRSLLEKYDEIDVAAETDSCESMVTLSGKFKPDVVVMDDIARSSPRPLAQWLSP